jgi:acetyl esterase/lipase
MGSMQVADLRKVATDHPTLRAYDSVNLIHNGDVLTDDSVALCTRFAAKGVNCEYERYMGYVIMNWSVHETLIN